MREENAIEVKDLKKQFKVYYDKGRVKGKDAVLEEKPL